MCNFRSLVARLRVVLAGDLCSVYIVSQCVSAYLNVRVRSRVSAIMLVHSLK